jgi:hypothetical protein
MLFLQNDFSSRRAIHRPPIRLRRKDRGGWHFSEIKYYHGHLPQSLLKEGSPPSSQLPSFQTYVTELIIPFHDCCFINWSICNFLKNNKLNRFVIS